MSEKQAKRIEWRVVIVCLLALAVAYPLSVGPAVWLFHAGKLPHQVLVVYRPVDRLARVTDWSERAFERYLDLWLPRDVSVEVEF